MASESQIDVVQLLHTSQPRILMLLLLPEPRGIYDTENTNNLFLWELS